MNRSIARALVLDAWYQVLDNKVFRLLAVLVGLLVLPTFLIGFRPQGIVVLWGLTTIRYQEFASWFGQSLPAEAKDLDLAFIQGVQGLVVEVLAGNVGVLFSIAATSFFVPRMLEKGAADVIFARPIARSTLLFARYWAGVLFVAILAAALVLGMHTGFVLVSGNSDPAFLWSILTLTYIFALVHAVSTLVAVWTRNSVAPILSGLLFFTGNGCVHFLWVKSDHGRAQVALAREEARASGETNAPPSDSSWDVLQHAVLDTLHFVLPKTNDADLIVGRLRRLASGDAPQVWDTPGQISVRELPPAFVLQSPPGEHDTQQAPLTWSWKAAGQPDALLSLRREPRALPPREPGGKPRKRSDTTAARELANELRSRAGVSGVRSAGASFARLSPEIVAWTEGEGSASVPHARAFVAAGEWIYVFEQQGGAALPEHLEAAHGLRALVDACSIERNDPRVMQSTEWHARQLAWDGPPRHNIFVSLGSSIAFAALLLWLAAWRLARIDF